MTPDPSTPRRDEHLEQVILEYLQAVDAVGSPDREEFLARHADLAAELKEFFAAEDGLAPAVEPWRLTASPPTSRVGEVVAGYELLEEVGRGGMGVVYKARQKSLNRVVALKMILSGAHASA
jgi:serine/threonine protein kinase